MPNSFAVLLMIIWPQMKTLFTMLQTWERRVMN